MPFRRAPAPRRPASPRRSARLEEHAQPGDAVRERGDADRLDHLLGRELAGELAGATLDGDGLVAHRLPGKRDEERVPAIELRRSEVRDDLVDGTGVEALDSEAGPRFALAIGAPEQIGRAHVSTPV